MSVSRNHSLPHTLPIAGFPSSAPRSVGGGRTAPGWRLWDFSRAGGLPAGWDGESGSQESYRCWQKRSQMIDQKTSAREVGK